jgi:hypothetical protein
VIDFSDIEKFVEERFGLEVTSSIVSNIMLLKVNGLDNNSLAKYIVQNLEGLKVSVSEKEGYKFGNNGWIKIEKTGQDSILQLTR